MCIYIIKSLPLSLSLYIYIYIYPRQESALLFLARFLRAKNPVTTQMEAGLPNIVQEQSVFTYTRFAFFTCLSLYIALTQMEAGLPNIVYLYFNAEIIANI